MITEHNYINIQGFMIKDLHLKGNELLVYALIYGFCQDGESKFDGSINYISEWLSSSRPTVINTLKSLEDKNLIIKHQEIKNNIIFNKYEVVKNFDYQLKNEKEGSKEILQGVVKKFNPIINNNNNINNKTTTKKEFTPPTIEEVKEYFASRNLREDVAIRFYEYYSTGFWKDGKGNKIKNWKQKVIAVWDKPEHKIKTQEQVQNVEKQDKEAESRNMWIKNCSLIKRTICKGKLLLVDIPNELIKRENKDDIYAIKTIQKMKERLLTEEELEILQGYIEILIR